MKKQHKRQSLSSSPLRTMLTGLAVSAVSLFLLLLIFSRILYSMGDPTKNISLFSCVSFALSALISGFITSKLGGERGKATSFVTSCVFAVILMIVSLIVTKGHMPPYNLACFAGYVLLGTLGGLLGGKREKKRRRTY